MRRNSLFFLTAFLLCGTSAASADDVETVVVSATRTAQPRDITGELVSVLNGQTLKTLQTVNLTDALVLTPGIVVDQNGGIGQTSSVSIRGAETGQTLFLIDGVRIGDPSGTDDGAILADVLANNIDRVEVLRGPQSTLYGSNAIGGVIDIFSKRGGATPFALDATAEAGSLGTYHLNAAANGTAGSVDYGAAANFIHTNGISAADKRGGNPETDGYRNFGGTGNVRVHINDNVSVDLRGYYTNARTDFDDNSLFFAPFLTLDSGAYSKSRFFSGYAGLNFDLFGGKLRNRIAVMGTSSDRSFYNSFFDFAPNQKDSDNKGDSTRVEYQGIADISPDDQVTFGAEDERTHFTGVGTFSNDRGRASIYSFYAQYQKTLMETLTLTGGVRYDHHSDFGSHTSLKIAGAWHVLDGTVIHANYGDGFKAPSLFELFSSYGTPTLKPETARGWEAGVEQAFADNRIHASLTYFARDTQNLIDFSPLFVYFNIGRTRVTGVEAELTGNLTDTLNVTVNYTNMDAKDRTTRLALNRRPHNTASAIVNWTPQSNWSVGGSVSYVGQQIDQYDTTTTPPTAFPNKGRALLNLFGHYDFDQWGLYARVDNLFAKRYEPLVGYGAPGRTFFAGIRVND